MNSSLKQLTRRQSYDDQVAAWLATIHRCKGLAREAVALKRLYRPDARSQSRDLPLASEDAHVQLWLDMGARWLSAAERGEEVVLPGRAEIDGLDVDAPARASSQRALVVFEVAVGG